LFVSSPVFTPEAGNKGTMKFFVAVGINTVQILLIYLKIYDHSFVSAIQHTRLVLQSWFNEAFLQLYKEKF
jgi:hypothetical protein